MYIALFPGPVDLCPPWWRYLPVFHSALTAATGGAGVQAFTAGSASQHSMYKQFQNLHRQISEKLQSEL